MKRKMICVSCLAALIATLAACQAPQEPAEVSVTTTAEAQAPVTTTTKAQAPVTTTTTTTAETSPAVPDAPEFEVEASDDGVEIKSYNGGGGVVTIPEEIDGKKVTTIGQFAFSMRTDISEVIFPDTLTRIEGGFFGCTGIEKITLPESVKEIYPSAFQGCSSIEEIVIPKNVMTLGMEAFLGCEKLRSIEVDPGNILFYSVDGVLFSRGFGALHTFPMGKTDVSSYTVPDGIERIYPGAFYGCAGLTEITLPQSVTEIGESAFGECAGLVGIDLPEGVKEIKNQTFSDCPSLASIEIPEGVYSIGHAAFWGCSGLVDVTIPDSVWKIDETSFAGCEQIKVTYKGKTYTYEELDALSDAL